MIAVIDYGICNVRSVTKALEKIGADVVQTTDEREIRSADGLVLPGVGSFKEGMLKLQERDLPGILEREVKQSGKPFLGICLGAQMAASVGHEFGKVSGLGWIDAEIVPFGDCSADIKVPHMGWNDVHFEESELFQRLQNPATFYFVHSYIFRIEGSQATHVIGTSNHGIDFPAAITKDNISLVQFHPEKSQKTGLVLLENFVDSC